MKHLFALVFLPVFFAAALGAQDTVRFTGCTYFFKNTQQFKGTTVRVSVNGVGEYSMPTGPGKHCVDLVVPVVGLPDNTGVSVYATKSVNSLDDRPLNGVTVGDLLKIGCHVLGLEPFSTPYSMIAADINRSGSVTTFDIVEAQKLLLDQYQQWPNNEVWRFPPADFVFPDPNNPFGGNPNVFTVGKLKTYHNDTLNVIGLKTGDVDGDARLDGIVYTGPSKIADTLLLTLPNVTIPANTTVEVPVSVSSPSVGALQVEFRTPSGVSITEFVSGSLGPILPSSFNFGSIGPYKTARLVVLKSNGSPANPSPVFKMKITSTETVALKDVISIGDGIPVLGFTSCNPSKASKLTLNFDGTLPAHDAAETPLRATPPAPNPFTDRALVEIELPESMPVLLEVFDLGGRLIWQQEQVLDSGQQQLEIPAEAVVPGSMGLYRVRAGAGVARGKVIRL